MEGADWSTEERFITHPVQFPVRLFLIGLQVSDLVMQSVIFFLYTLEFLFLLFCLAFSSLPVGVRYYMPSLCMLYAVFIAYGMFKSVRLKKRLRFSVSPINLNCMWLQPFSQHHPWQIRKRNDLRTYIYTYVDSIFCFRPETKKALILL